MTYQEFMNAAKAMFNNWEECPELNTQYSKEELAKIFLESIQGEIGSSLNILTNDELKEANEKYYKFMESHWI